MPVLKLPDDPMFDNRSLASLWNTIAKGSKATIDNVYGWQIGIQLGLLWKRPNGRRLYLTAKGKEILERQKMIFSSRTFICYDVASRGW